jgi:serine-type anaerobic sulfatase-maturating enzyme
MPDDVLESFIRQKIKNHQFHKVSFAWQGGEPTLLGVDYFRNVVKLQKKYAQGRLIENSFQTNGILLDDAWCTFFKENNFLVGISIDGPEELHNQYRLNKGGKATFKQVMRGMEFLKKHQVEFNTLTVIQAHNSQKPLDVYNFLKEVGSGFIQFIPIVERNTEKLQPTNYRTPENVTEWSVKPEQFGIFLCEIFDEWVRKDVGQYFIQLFDIALEAWYGIEPGLCVFRETCGTAMAIEHNGDLYSCDHYVYPENKLGNIMANPMAGLIRSELQVQFGKNKLDKLPAYCRKCEVRFICNGECPKNRFISTPDGEPGLNYLCAGYKKFFKHIDPYMCFMVSELKNKRPPANVMDWEKNC